MIPYFSLWSSLCSTLRQKKNKQTNPENKPRKPNQTIPSTDKDSVLYKEQIPHLKKIWMIKPLKKVSPVLSKKGFGQLRSAAVPVGNMHVSILLYFSKVALQF